MIFFNNFSIKKLYIKRVSWFSLYNFSFNYFTLFSFENLKIFYFIIISFSSKKFFFFKKGFLFSNLFFQNFFYNLCKLNIFFIDSMLNTKIFNFFYNRKFNKKFFRVKKGFFFFNYQSILRYIDLKNKQKKKKDSKIKVKNKKKNNKNILNKKKKNNFLFFFEKNKINKNWNVRSFRLSQPLISYSKPGGINFSEEESKKNINKNINNNINNKNINNINNNKVNNNKINYNYNKNNYNKNNYNFNNISNNKRNNNNIYKNIYYNKNKNKNNNNIYSKYNNKIYNNIHLKRIKKEGLRFTDKKSGLPYKYNFNFKNNVFKFFFFKNRIDHNLIFLETLKDKKTIKEKKKLLENRVNLIKKEKFKIKEVFFKNLKKKIIRRKKYKKFFTIKVRHFTYYLYRFFKIKNFLSSFLFFNHKRFLSFLNVFYFKIFKFVKNNFFFKKIKYIYLKDIFFIFKRVIFFKFNFFSEKRMTAATLARFFFFRIKYRVPIKVLFKFSFFKRIKKLVKGYRVFAKGRFTRKDRASDLFFWGGGMPGSSAKYGNIESASVTMNLKNSLCHLKVMLFKGKFLRRSLDSYK